MSSRSSCIVREFPLPNREYRAAPPERWDDFSPPAPARRSPPRRSRRRRRQNRLTPLALAGLALFCCGFLLGRAGAEPLPLEPSENGVILPEEPDSTSNSGGVQILGVPGAVLSGDRPEQTAGTTQAGASSGTNAGTAQGGTSAGKNAGTAQAGASSGTNAGTAQGGTSAGKTAGTPAGTASSSDWNLILVNGDHPLPENFQVPELTKLRNGHAIDSRAYPALQAMMDAARAAGYQPTICSSFRTWDKQSELYEKKVASCMAQGYGREEAERQAAVWVARPGTSEHQAGLAVDIVDVEYQLLDQAQEDRPVQRWLMEHCAEYGFILRYPTDKSALTGVGYEPWHYRYVGTEAAKAIMDSGLCLEEYLAQ